MAEITAQDWRTLTDQVHKIAVTVEELKGGAKASADKLQELWTFHKDAEKFMSRAYIAGYAVTLFALAAVAGVYNGVQRLAAIEATAATKEQVAELKATVTHQTQDITALRSQVTQRAVEGVSFVRHPSYPDSRFPSRFGRISRISKESITLELLNAPPFFAPEKAEKSKLEYTCEIAKGARVIVKGESAMLEDLKVGMMVYVVQSHDKAELLEVPSASEGRPPAPLLPPPATK